MFETPRGIYRHHTLTGRHIYTDCLLTESQILIQYALLCRDKMTYLFSITNPAFPVHTPMDTKGGQVDHLHVMIKDSSGSSSWASSFQAIIESIIASTYFFSSIKWCCGLKDRVWLKWCHGGGCTEVPSVWELFFGFWLCGNVTWILLPYWTFLLPDLWIPLRFGCNSKLTPVWVLSMTFATTMVSDHFFFITHRVLGWIACPQDSCLPQIVTLFGNRVFADVIS